MELPLLKGQLGKDKDGNDITDLRLQIGANENQFIKIDMGKINVTVGGEDDGKLNILNDIIQEGSKGFKVTKKTNYRYVQ